MELRTGSKSRWAMPEVSSTGSEAARKEHHDFAVRMWARIDRDNSGKLNRSELDCEEFHTIVRSVLVADSTDASTGGPLYARSQMNVVQAVNFCLRKADLNGDGYLTFKEFESYLMMLSKERKTIRTAYLIFALFDLDGNGYVDQREFRELCRFYLGRNLRHEEFQEEWAKIDRNVSDKVTMADYIRWLEMSDNPIFRQHAPEASTPSAPPIEAAVGPATWADAFRGKGSSSSSSGARAHVTAHALRAGHLQGGRALWDQKLMKANSNFVLPPAQRNYFSRPQSLPELGRYYESHRGFRQHRRNDCSKPEPKRKSPVLSNEMTSFLPDRYIPGGTMRGKEGYVIEWEDHWQLPVSLKPRIKPACLDFQHPGPPPRWMSHYKEDAD